MVCFTVGLIVQRLVVASSFSTYARLGGASSVQSVFKRASGSWFKGLYSRVSGSGGGGCLVAYPKDPCTQIVYTLAPKYQYRDYFKA